MTSQNDLGPYNLSKGHSNKNDSHSSCSEPSCMNTNQRSHSIASFSTYYIGGDLNISFLQNESKVKAYIDMTYSLGAISLITHPTRVTDNSSSLLDHEYTNNISGETHSYILLDDIICL